MNLQGQVIGITTAVADSQGVGFALPISAEFVTSLVASIQTYQAIVRPLIGIEYVDVTPVLQMEKKLSVSEGIVVTSVLEGMPAKEAGLQKGDIVTAINDKPITTTHPFLYHIYTYTPGTTISLTVIRDGQTLKISVDLGQNAQ